MPYTDQEIPVDTRCPRCTEPWDLDTFHEAADEQDSTFDAVHRAFQADGCIALGWQTTPCERVDNDMALVTGMLNEMLGDDVDGIAADLADFEMLFGEDF